MRRSSENAAKKTDEFNSFGRDIRGRGTDVPNYVEERAAPGWFNLAWLIVSRDLFNQQEMINAYVSKLGLESRRPQISLRAIQQPCPNRIQLLQLREIDRDYRRGNRSQLAQTSFDRCNAGDIPTSAGRYQELFAGFYCF